MGSGQKILTEKWFFVASYVVTDNSKLTERDVDNDMPHCSIRGKADMVPRISRRVLIPRNVDIIVHIPFGELIFVRHYIRCNKEPICTWKFKQVRLP